MGFLYFVQSVFTSSWYVKATFNLFVCSELIRWLQRLFRITRLLSVWQGAHLIINTCCVFVYLPAFQQYARLSDVTLPKALDMELKGDIEDCLIDIGKNNFIISNAFWSIFNLLGKHFDNSVGDGVAGVSTWIHVDEEERRKPIWKLDGSKPSNTSCVFELISS